MVAKKKKIARKSGMNAKKNRILVFCAHPDDEVIGVGGSLLHYKKKGYKSTAVIFSYGEGSHPWQKKQYIAKTRVLECKKAGKMIGCEDHIFLAIKDGHIPAAIKKKNVAKMVRKLIEKNRPKKIFTHSKDDPFPDHRAVNRVVLDTIKKMKYNCDVYSFDIWNPFNIRGRNKPKLIVDISKEWKTKLNAIRTFKSQKANALSLLWPFIYLRGILNGLFYGHKFAEVFMKIK